MPVVFRHNGIRFYFFSNEGNPWEPVHIHVEKADAEAKLWVTPDVRIADCVGFSRREQTELLRIIKLRKDEIIKAWHEHFGDNSPV